MIFMNARVTDNCITIFESYKISKKQFKFHLNNLRDTNGNCNVLKYRSNCSLSNEWACHNFLYALHIARSRTINVDMQYPLTWWEKILYPAVGWFCKIWIK